MAIIHGLPGLAADRRMFPSPWEAVPGFIVHDWPRYGGEETLGDVARTVCNAHNIRDGDVVVGASLGGMVGCEIARLRRLHSLFLIGSAITGQEVSRFLALLHPLARVAPFEWLQRSAVKIPSLGAQMFSGVDASLVRSMCAAVFRWEGKGSVSVRSYRLHGRRDLIIPPPKQADLLLNGGHMISITHARECVEFVSATLKGEP